MDDEELITVLFHFLLQNDFATIVALMGAQASYLDEHQSAVMMLQAAQMAKPVARLRIGGTRISRVFLMEMDCKIEVQLSRTLPRHCTASVRLHLLCISMRSGDKNEILL